VIIITIIIMNMSRRKKKDKKMRKMMDMIVKRTRERTANRARCYLFSRLNI